MIVTWLGALSMGTLASATVHLRRGRIEPGPDFAGTHVGGRMPRYAIAAAAAALFSIPALAQPTFEIGPEGVRIGGGRGGYCEQLRRACEYKEELGEVGQGNCRRYREECGSRRPSASLCRELRYACLHKEELGEEGMGNCRRYRETCRGY